MRADRVAQLVAEHVDVPVLSQLGDRVRDGAEREGHDAALRVAARDQLALPLVAPLVATARGHEA